MLRITAPQGVSLDYTTQQMRAHRGADPAAARFRRDRRHLRDRRPERPDYNSGFMVLTLAPWDERERAASRRSSPSITGLPQAGAGRPHLRRCSRTASASAAPAAACSSPSSATTARSSATPPTRSSPRWRRTRASSSRGSRTDADAAAARRRDRPRARLRPRHRHHRPRRQRCRRCSTATRSATVFIDDRSYEVKLVSTTNPINDPTDLENIFLKTADGRYRADVDHRHADRARRAAVADPRAADARRSRSPPACAPDFALGDALARAVRRSPRRCCRPAAASFRSPKPRRSARRNSGMVTIFGFALVIILLVLAAQFESFVSAVIIMATVPLGLACAVVRAGAHRHQPQRLQPDRPGAAGRRHGQERHPDRRVRQPAARPRRWACARRSSRPRSIRLRPVMMTMICTVLGGLPLVLASRRRRRGAHRARLGHRRRPRPGDGARRCS